MVIAYFHRTLAACFFLLLIAAAMAAFVTLTYLASAMGMVEMLQYNFPIVAMISSLVCIVFAIAIFLVVFRDPRAIWIEDGALHFYSSFFGDLFFFLVSGKTVPLDSIAGLSHVKSEFPGAVNRYGIYVELRSGASYKIMTFLLRERKDVVMAHLHVALGLPKPSPEVLHQLKF